MIENGGDADSVARIDFNVEFRNDLAEAEVHRGEVTRRSLN